MHAWLAGAIPALVLVHVLSAFAFALVHGPSVYVLWALRTEQDPARMGALLDLSRRSNGGSWVAYMALGLSGLALALVEHTWREPWVWASAILLVLLTLAMSAMGARAFNHARHALGLAWFSGRGVEAATGVVDGPLLEDARRRIRGSAPALVLLGSVGLGLLVWLMVRRPG